MNFDSEHKVKIESLTDMQAPLVIGFLLDERKRHVKCMQEADFKWSVCPMISEIYESASTRHLEDIVGIDMKIKRIEEAFGL